MSAQVDWLGLLRRLASELQVSELVAHHDNKPLSLFFEELCAHLPGPARKAESLVKCKIAALLGEYGPHSLHFVLADLFDVVLTTNYDYTLEHAVGGSMVNANMHGESRYSLFRRMQVGDKEVWHIHGDVSRPETILLGYDHYAGYLQKIRNYLTDGLNSSNPMDRFRSPLKTGAHEFEKWGLTHSWADHFLRDHLHIVGLSLDFTEIDLWWLLVHKRRRSLQTGRSFYYTVDVAGAGTTDSAPRISLLRALGVEVVVVAAKDYVAGYQAVVHRVAENIELYPTLACIKLESFGRRPVPLEVAPIPETCQVRVGDQVQLNLGLRRKRLKRSSEP